MSYRKARMVRESFEAQNAVTVDETLESDVSFINSDISDVELDTHFAEGEILIGDTDTVETLEDLPDTDDLATNVTRQLAVESIAKRWCLQTEAMLALPGPTKKKTFKETIVALWQRFIEWSGNLIKSMIDGFTNLFAVSTGLLKAADKNKGIIRELPDTPLNDKMLVVGPDNIAAISVDGKRDINIFMTGFAENVLTLQKDIQEWTVGNVDVATKYIALSVDNANGGVNRVEDWQHPFDNGKLISSVFFKKTESKLQAIGPKDADEEQFLIPIVGNDYIQVFKYSSIEHTAGEGEDIPYSVHGIRFISAKGEYSANHRDFHDIALDVRNLDQAYEYDTLDKNDLTKLNQNLEFLAKGLKRLEQDNKKVKASISKMHGDAKEAMKRTKDKEGTPESRATAKIANRQAREAIMITTASYRSISALTKNSAKGIIVLIKAACVSFKNAAVPEAA